MLIYEIIYEISILLLQLYSCKPTMPGGRGLVSARNMDKHGGIACVGSGPTETNIEHMVILGAYLMVVVVVRIPMQQL